MKRRISATIDEETSKLIDRLLKDGDFRNKSHVIEKAIRKLWQEQNEDTKNKKK